jgi:hypothetical protein
MRETLSSRGETKGCLTPRKPLPHAQVALLTARQRPSSTGGPTHVVAFVASAEAALGGAAAVEQLAQSFVAARVRLDVAVLGCPDEVAPATAAALEALAGA